MIALAYGAILRGPFLSAAFLYSPISPPLLHNSSALSPYRALARIGCSLVSVGCGAALACGVYARTPELLRSTTSLPVRQLLRFRFLNVVVGRYNIFLVYCIFGREGRIGFLYLIFFFVCVERERERERGGGGGGGGGRGLLHGKERRGVCLPCVVDSFPGYCRFLFQFFCRLARDRESPVENNSMRTPNPIDFAQIVSSLHDRLNVPMYYVCLPIGLFSLSIGLLISNLQPHSLRFHLSEERQVMQERRLSRLSSIMLSSVRKFLLVNPLTMPLHPLTGGILFGGLSFLTLAISEEPPVFNPSFPHEVCHAHISVWM